MPQLRHQSLDYLQPEVNKDNIASSNNIYPLKNTFKRIPIPPLENLGSAIQGPQMWAEQAVLPSRFRQLRRLFVANVPVMWDVFWVLFLLDAEPVLETLHVHVDGSEKKNTGEVCTGVVDAQHPPYNHVVLVRQIMKLSPVLRCVHLLDGDVGEDQGALGNLEIVQHRSSKWRGCERAEIIHD